jgi:dihydrofolate reductase
MAKLTMTTFLTVDGVMQAPGTPEEDRSDGFDQGGWLVPHFDEETGHFMTAVFERVDAFLLGRTTYQIFSNHWPRVTDPNDIVARKLNTLPKHVASTSLDAVSWTNSSLVRDVVGEIAEIKARYPGELQVHGSRGLAQTLIANDLVDEYNLLVFPVVLGEGKRLFGEGAVPAALQRLSTQTTPSGVIITTYRRAGRPTYGSFALET